MGKKLFIIGNGFDINLGIASKYSDFRIYAENSLKIDLDLNNQKAVLCYI